MKTKLSFLALPLCLGLALTFALAACDSGGGSKEKGTSSGSGSTYQPSSDANDAQGLITMDFQGVDCNDDGRGYDGICQLMGSISTGNSVTIVKVSVTTENSDWVSYNGGRADNITTPTNYFKLNNVEIDLTKPTMLCNKEYSITVKACLDPACNTGNFAQSTKKFTKPQYFCNKSSSGGGSGTPSSSSEAVYKFGPKNTDGMTAGKNEVKNLGSASFKLEEGEGGDLISAIGGTLSLVPYAFSDDYPDPGPVANTPYSAADIPVQAPMQSGGLQIDDYYLLIPTASGGDRYLIRIRTYNNWPKNVDYWKVMEYPK